MVTDTFRVFVRGIPQPQGSKTNIRNEAGGIVGSRESCKGLKSWRQQVREVVTAAWDGPPWDGPIEMSLRFQMLRPKSVSQKKRPRPSVYPDGSKLQRAVEDALVQAGALRDDALIVSWQGIKEYSEIPGVEIELRRL